MTSLRELIESKEMITISHYKVVGLETTLLTSDYNKALEFSNNMYTIEKVHVQYPNMFGAKND